MNDIEIEWKWVRDLNYGQETWRADAQGVQVDVLVLVEGEIIWNVGGDDGDVRMVHSGTAPDVAAAKVAAEAAARKMIERSGAGVTWEKARTTIGNGWKWTSVIEGLATTVIVFHDATSWHVDGEWLGIAMNAFGVAEEGAARAAAEAAARRLAAAGWVGR